MPVIKLKGPGLNDYFAEQMVKDYGPVQAREKCSGPMLESVNRVIEKRKAQTLKAFDDFAHSENRERLESKVSIQREARDRL